MKNAIVKTEQEVAELALLDEAIFAEMQAEGDDWGEFIPEKIRLSQWRAFGFSDR